MTYEERKRYNGTTYTIRTEKIATGLTLAQVFYADVDMPVKEVRYRHDNLVTCASAIWCEYKQEIQKAIAGRRFDEFN